MIWFILGLIIGVVITAPAVYIYLRRQTEELRRDLSFLRARLRSLARLTEFGLLKPESVEAANLLTQLHDLTNEPATPATRSVPPFGDEDDDVKSILG